MHEDERPATGGYRFPSAKPIGQLKRVTTRTRKLNPEKEWAKVRYAWNGDVEAWEKYSGFKLPSTERR